MSVTPCNPKSNSTSKIVACWRVIYDALFGIPKFWQTNCVKGARWLVCGVSNALVNCMTHPLYPRQGPSLLSHWPITSDSHVRHFTSIVSHRCDSCVRHFLPIVQQVIGTVYQRVSLLWLTSESFYSNCQSMKWLWCASIDLNCMTHIGQWRTLPGV